jgi:translation initiation factor 2B subunit (eIF-2B alpha/beta/delta family)
MPQTLIMKVVGLIAVVGLISLSLYAAANHFESIGYQKRVAEDQAHLNTELVASKDKSIALQHQLNEAQNALSKAKSDLYSLGNLNRNALNSLRSNFNSFNSSLPSDSRDALTKRISSLSAVVEDCSARLIEVASDADIAIAEIKMLENAWPK